MIAGLLNLRNPKTSVMNRGEVALEYLMFLKLKIDEVTIQGRGFADRRKHQYWLSKKDTSSPTVFTKGLMILCMIYAMEGQEVATADIPGVFLQTDYD